MRDDASIVPYKWLVSLWQMNIVHWGKVFLRRGEGTHLRPKSRTCGPVGLRNAPAGAAPYRILIGWQRTIKCSVGNGLDRSETLPNMPQQNLITRFT